MCVVTADTFNKGYNVYFQYLVALFTIYRGQISDELVPGISSTRPTVRIIIKSLSK
jgi:hypothetical protein